MDNLSKEYISEDKKDVSLIVGRFDDIFQGGFMVRTSDIHTWIENQDLPLQEMDKFVLPHNVEFLYDHISEERPHSDDTCVGLLNLLNIITDVVRLKSIEMQVSIRNEDVKDDLKKAEAKLGNVTKKTHEVQAKMDRYQLEVVSILAIFAAIVLAFSGGVSVLGNAIGNVTDENFREVTFEVIIASIVLFDTVAFLMNAIWCIMRRREETYAGNLVGTVFIFIFNIFMVVLLITIYNS